MNRILSGVLLSLTIATPAFAQQKAPEPAKAPEAGKPEAAKMMPPKPAPEMAQLKLMQGSWKCSGKMEATPFSPAHAMETRVIGKPDLDGFWMVVRIEGKKTKEMPMAFKGVWSGTYDPGAKKFESTFIDNMGGLGVQSSTGWEGDKMVWSGEGTMMGQKVGMRDTFTKKSDTELVHTFEMQSGGKWMPMGEETCKRQ
jgi:hypothetical protein